MARKAASKEEAIALFWAKVDTSAGPDACHPWTGAIKSNGYGHMNVQTFGGDKDAHVIAYELTNGELQPEPETGRKPDIDHKCHNADPSCPRGKRCQHRRCCNELHLETKTRSQNLLDANAGHASGQFADMCPAGTHPMTGKNVGWANRKTGGPDRFCKACMRERSYLNRTGVPRPGPLDERIIPPKDEKGKFVTVTYPLGKVPVA